MSARDSLVVDARVEDCLQQSLQCWSRLLVQCQPFKLREASLDPLFEGPQINFAFSRCRATSELRVEERLEIELVRFICLVLELEFLQHSSEADGAIMVQLLPTHRSDH